MHPKRGSLSPVTRKPSNPFTRNVGEGSLESGGTISSGTPRSPRTQVYHLCQAGLRGSKSQIQTCSEVSRQHSVRHLPGPAAPSPAFSRSTSRSNLGASTRSFACQVNRSAPSRQQQRSHGDSLKTSCRSRSLDSDATVQADSALTTTTAVSPERIIRYRRVLKPHTSTRRTSSSVASATRRRGCELHSRRRLKTVADEKLGNRRVQII